MLDALQGLALLGLLICQYYLIRGCFAIQEGIADSGGSITTKIDRTADLLDEMAQLIADFSDSMGGEQHPQPPMSPMNALLTAFMSRTPMADHATQSEEWEVLPNNDNPPQTVQAEN